MWEYSALSVSQYPKVDVSSYSKGPESPLGMHVAFPSRLSDRRDKCELVRLAGDRHTRTIRKHVLVL